MGFWGSGPLDNDSAADWFDEFANRKDVLQRAQTAILGALTIQAPLPDPDLRETIWDTMDDIMTQEALACGLAAAEVVARSIADNTGKKAKTAKADWQLVVLATRLVMHIRKLGWSGSDQSASEAESNDLLERLLRLDQWQSKSGTNSTT